MSCALIYTSISPNHKINTGMRIIHREKPKAGEIFFLLKKRSSSCQHLIQENC
uniref:Uncharacterized protein n=1 Tax=Rhizophora mucronata TaxID=61149 RepID=A0A2P2Q0E9_RHIMU